MTASRRRWIFTWLFFLGLDISQGIPRNTTTCIRSQSTKHNFTCGNDEMLLPKKLTFGNSSDSSCHTTTSSPAPYGPGTTNRCCKMGHHDKTIEYCLPGHNDEIRLKDYVEFTNNCTGVMECPHALSINMQTVAEDYMTLVYDCISNLMVLHMKHNGSLTGTEVYLYNDQNDGLADSVCLAATLEPNATINIEIVAKHVISSECHIKLNGTELNTTIDCKSSPKNECSTIVHSDKNFINMSIVMTTDPRKSVREFLWIKATASTDSNVTVSCTRIWHPVIEVTLPTTQSAVVKQNKTTTQSTAIQQNKTTTQSTTVKQNKTTTQSTIMQQNKTTQATTVKQNKTTTQSTTVKQNKTTTQSTTVRQTKTTTQSTTMQQNKTTTQSTPVKQNKTTTQSTPVKQIKITTQSTPVKQNKTTTQSTPVKQNKITTQSTTVKQNKTTTQSTPVKQNKTTTQSTTVKQNKTTTQSTTVKQNKTTTQSTTVKQNKTTTQSTTVRQKKTTTQSTTVKQSKTTTQSTTVKQISNEQNNKTTTMTFRRNQTSTQKTLTSIVPFTITAGSDNSTDREFLVRVIGISVGSLLVLAIFITTVTCVKRKKENQSRCSQQAMSNGNCPNRRAVANTGYDYDPDGGFEDGHNGNPGSRQERRRDRAELKRNLWVTPKPAFMREFS